MQKIATLGPSNTFSEKAAKIYIQKTGIDHKIDLFPSFNKVFAAMTADCDTGIFPIENMTEGHVSNVLDILVNSDFSIVDEILLPIQFSLVGNCGKIEDVEKLYVQFVSQRQCEKIVDRLSSSAAVITTESNGASLEQVKKGIAGEAAIVPVFCAGKGDFELVVENVADYANNQTRFVVIKKSPARHDPKKDYKTSLLVYETTDRAGVLSEILQAFASRKINLVSIMSRPTKEILGRYHFFIDIEGYFFDSNVQEAVAEIEKGNIIKMLGSYPKAENVKTGADKSDKVFKGLGFSPFADDKRRPGVYWGAGNGPYENTVSALERIDLSPAKGKRVLLKPNVGRDVAAELGINTHPQVVAAAIDAFRKAGAYVAVGESPITGVDTLQAFENCGVAAVARERNCPLIDMNERKFVPMEVPGGAAIDSLKVCREVTEFDIVVSIPVMKTHMHTGVTLAVKNMKGCLWRRSKVDLHMLDVIEGYDEKPLDIAISDMSGLLKPHLSIIDGTIGLEGLGPGSGMPKPLGVVIAGVDAFAADAAACAIMGIDAGDVTHLRMGAERGYGVIDMDKIRIEPEGWEKVVDPFERPPEKLSIEFAGFNIHDKKSCSACQSTLLLFLKKHGDELLESRKDDKAIDIAIGKGHEDLPEGTICVGNCTAKHKNKGTFVPGCPPVVSAILNEYFINDE